MSKRILCFGDSLTWGWVPRDSPAAPSERYPREVRWTGVLADQLGAEFEVVEEGLNGRTTSADDPMDPRLNGATYLPAALASHLPLDLVIVMLGTNDTKAYFRRTAFDIAIGASLLLRQIAASAVGTAYPAPRALLVAPPKLSSRPNPWFQEVFAGGEEKTAELPRLYAAAADFVGAAFFDAGSVITTGGVDGIHFSRQNNHDLGVALAREVGRLVSPAADGPTAKEQL